ncbi:conserved hypothetical protein [Talaromyces stipitatus ATCC 10500]|uniref:Uncharacterized protein n=1 Tax=Talaromyces stipitatus (strain ATCC 10500 / CBS 375.48 / QM 6759 / NRRL 1006) TaxID=441959 RepID=B8MN51_TALSN|nr:uncharacterized protein TSTA_107080 [Talaromyces stipitatus ATCC 10500]EED14500.1 conserved hypothetical protein [Talaromyces stipitatus ATCC 10500]
MLTKQMNCQSRRLVNYNDHLINRPRLPIAMPVTPNTLDKELIFVNAPKLARTRTESEDGESSIRSRLIRQVVRQKKANSAKQLLVKKPDGVINPVASEDGTSLPDDFNVPIPYAAGAAAPLSENRARTVAEPTTGNSVDDNRIRQMGIPDLLTVLSAFRSDPFSPWHMELGRRGNEVLDYCKSKDPGVTVGDVSTNFGPPFAPLHTPRCVIVAAFIKGAGFYFHLDLNRGGQTGAKESVETLRYLELALQALQENLASTTPATVSDEVILSILYLAVNHQVKARAERDPSPFTPPQRNLHHLDLFGTTTFHASHWKIAKDLVQGRGGIHTIKMVTLPWLLTMADLLHAVGSLTRPSFPLLRPTGQPVIYTPPCRALRVPEVARHFHRNGGFTQLKSLNPSIHQPIVEVFLDICEYSQCLDFLDQTVTYPTDELGDCRDIIHHRFMNLPNEHDPNESIFGPSYLPCPEACQLTRSIYLLVRSAALLYITHVTFPLPRPLRLRKQLLTELESHFTSVGGAGYYPPGVPLELLLWPATIAATASKDESCRMQWILLVRQLCQQTLISTWDEFRLIMQSFSWVNCACDKEGYAVWTDVQLLG